MRQSIGIHAVRTLPVFGHLQCMCGHPQNFLPSERKLINFGPDLPLLLTMHELCSVNSQENY